ncbi:MAG: HAD family hydrolase [Prevotellaceae bacterium]|jgi:phosphoglycolate phosphatase|nr:HAD family hydrolase [Prevotellaceae bacterium]
MDKKYKAIIFDLDGTLINSIPDIADSMNEVLSAYGYPQYNHNQYKYFVGNGIKKLVERCVPPEYATPENIANIFRTMIDVYGNNCVNKTHVYEGIYELLDDLSAKRVKMAILSNKTDSITQKIYDKLFRDCHFELVLGATDNFPKKPNPASALFVAESLSVAPYEVFYLGDTSIDMETACSAGFFPAGASWGFRPAEELLSFGAKFIAETPNDCLRFFE